MQALQWLSAVRLHGCHQPGLTSKYHVSTDSGRANLFYWRVLFISMGLSYIYIYILYIYIYIYIASFTFLLCQLDSRVNTLVFSMDTECPVA